MEDLLIRLAQLQAIMRTVHTSGDDTLCMASSLSLLAGIIENVQRAVNKKAEDSPPE